VAGPAALSRYAADLVVPADIAAECALLKAVAVHFVMNQPAATRRQTGQRRLLTELVELIAAGAPATLDRGLAPAWREAADDPARLRVVIDQVAQLTDTSALVWHRRLVGARA
jgi:dGTPase